MQKLIKSGSMRRTQGLKRIIMSQNSINNISDKVLLVILDGYGKREDTLKNAVESSNSPELDDLFANYPTALIESGGLAVGLPKGVSGNSEVGHLNLGAGRAIRQDLVRINEHISNGTLKDLPVLKEFEKKVMGLNKRVHLMGLLSDGGVHSHINHIKEFIKILSSNKDLEIYFHAFMDGRDTPIQNGVKYLEELLKVPGFKLASVQGRSIGMDRDRRWEKIKRTYDMMTGQGNISSEDPLTYMKNEYDHKIYDEFITPVLFDKDFAIKSEDSVFFCNYRPDRAKQITLAFMEEGFNEFNRPVQPAQFLCLTPYVEEEVKLPILLDKEKVKGGFSEIISNNKWGQFKIAETEKYAHVTYFFNGGRKDPFPGEERSLVPSNRAVATYDEVPQMSAPEITEKLLEALDKDNYKFFLVNYANSDMVGHTGNYEAAVKAVESLDECIGKLKKKCAEKNICLVLTADHGNSDQMIYEDGSPHTSHTESPVPFTVFHPKLKNSTLKSTGDFALCDVSPTMLKIIGEQIPSYFTGKPIFG
jgi:2,3-bisphosphoglycerate-independent phosphoglycerate mutase